MHVLLQADQRLKQKHKDVLCHLFHKNYTCWGKNLDRYWTPDYSFNDHSVSNKLINLLRHGSLPREDDGAIEFWRAKDYLQNHFVYSQHSSYEKCNSIMARGGGNKKYFSIVLILQEKFFHSELSKVIQDAILLILHYRQDNVWIPDVFFKYIYHIGCAINLHSIINSGLILGGQNLSNRQTVFFLLWILLRRNTRILRRSTWDHRVLHGTCIKHGRKHHNTVYRVDIKLAQKKG